MEKDSKYRQIAMNHANIEENQERVLSCLKDYTSVLGELYKFEALLYDKNYNLPRSFFKQFRSIREGIESSFNTLEGYISYNGLFIQQKDRIIEEQITLTQSHISKGKFNSLAQSQINRKRVETDYKDRRGTIADANQIELLKGEIQTLKNQLRKNDSEYEIQIKKYNMKYQQMLNDIRFYEEKMMEVDEYLQTIDKLEVEVRLMKQIKDRDEGLIRSMARKLKNYEVQKNGRSMLLSPTRQDRSFLSPSRISSQLSPKRYNRY